MKKQTSPEIAMEPQKLSERDPTVDISILLPVRSRPEPMKKCLHSLIDLAKNPERIEVLIAFDDDDIDTINYFFENIAPYLDNLKVRYNAMQFKRMGYIRLNEYLNTLSKNSHGAWMFFCNDDAVMITKNWDQAIIDYGTEFALLRTETNHSHPYAIFPIVPRKWVEITGHFSPHQLNDAWISQVAWMLDIVKNIPVLIIHERYDLTGKNGDEVFNNRPMLEGNPSDPRDFHHPIWRKARVCECLKLSKYLKSLGKDLTHFNYGLVGKDADGNEYNIWCKMFLSDSGKRIKEFTAWDQQIL